MNFEQPSPQEPVSRPQLHGQAASLSRPVLCPLVVYIIFSWPPDERDELLEAEGETTGTR